MTRLFVFTFFILALASLAHAQKLPDKIRGYKVENVALKISYAIPDGKKLSDDFDLHIQLTKPQVKLNGLLSAAIEVGADTISTRHSGEIDFVSFHDVRVNGIPIDVAEYAGPLSMKKGIRSTLPRSVKATVGITGAARGALRKLIDSREKWRVTGTAFIFGRFKKLGFTFKRVVPIKIDMLVDNPLK